MNSKNKISFNNSFFIFLMISFVGNICTDYGIIWYAISKLNSDSSKIDISIFYIGQSIGIIFLSPILNSYFERFSRAKLAILVDISYCLALVGIYIVFKLDLINKLSIFTFAALSASLNAVHKGSVGLSAVKQMSAASGDLTDWVAKYFATLHVPFIFATALSGILFKLYGLEGCLLLAFLSFVPLPYFYLKIFKDNTVPENYHFMNKMKTGLQLFLTKKEILHTAISISILNIPTSVFPAMIGIGYSKLYPNDPQYASIAISISILIGILLLKSIGRVAKTWSLNKVILYSSLPMILFCLVGYAFPNPYFLTFIFAVTCIGSSARNIVSGTVRVSMVKNEEIGSVNTFFQSTLHMGQVIGGYVVISYFSENIYSMITGILLFAAVSIAYSLLTLPKITHSKT